MSNLENFKKNFDAEKLYEAVMNATVSTGILNASRNSNLKTVNLQAFSVEVESGKACNQKQSGRCWMFASLNVMRLDVMKKLKLENMELSQAYPFFMTSLKKRIISLNVYWKHLRRTRLPV